MHNEQQDTTTSSTSTTMKLNTSNTDSEIAILDADKAMQAAIAIRKRAKGYYPTGNRDELYSVHLQRFISTDFVASRLAHGEDQPKGMCLSILNKLPIWCAEGVVNTDEAYKPVVECKKSRTAGFNLAYTAGRGLRMPKDGPDKEIAQAASQEAVRLFTGLLDIMFQNCPRSEQVWFTHWIRKQVLYPTTKTDQIPILNDTGNSGKSTIGRVIRLLIGNRSSIKFESVESLNDDFVSGQMVGKTFIQVDEAITGSRNLLQKLKGWTAGTDLVVNRKGIQQQTVQFYGDFIIYSNADWSKGELPLPFESQNRRLFYFRTSLGGKDLAKALHELLNESGSPQYIGALVGIRNYLQSYSERDKAVIGGYTSGFQQLADFKAGERTDHDAHILSKTEVAKRPVVRLTELLDAGKGITLDRLKTLLEDAGYTVWLDARWRSADAVTTQLVTSYFGKVSRLHFAVRSDAVNAAVGSNATASVVLAHFIKDAVEAAGF